MSGRQSQFFVGISKVCVRPQAVLWHSSVVREVSAKVPNQEAHHVAHFPQAFARLGESFGPYLQGWGVCIDLASNSVTERGMPAHRDILAIVGRGAPHAHHVCAVSLRAVRACALSWNYLRCFEQYLQGITTATGYFCPCFFFCLRWAARAALRCALVMLTFSEFQYFSCLTKQNTYHHRLCTYIIFTVSKVA